MSKVYYNEFDKYPAQWLRNLIAAGLIPAGDVDERSINDVRAEDLKGYTQCHFFAGIGGWSYALRLAGWPDERPVWTGSCPCQPFSVAGAQKAQADERHLWPVWFGLIRECRPTTVFGEQVSGAIAHGWLDDVYQGLEGEGYAVGAAVLPATSVGAPHKRDRLWFVANAGGAGRRAGLLCQRRNDEQSLEQRRSIIFAEPSETSAPLAHANNKGSQRRNSTELSERACEQFVRTSSSPEATLGISDCAGRDARGQSGEIARQGDTSFSTSPNASSMADTEGNGRQQRRAEPIKPRETGRPTGDSCEFRAPGQRNNQQSLWDSEPGVGLLANGIPARVGKLRAFGNAIVPQLAAEFIAAFMECEP